MAKQQYLCIQRNNPENRSGEKPSPAQMEQMYAAFNSWKDKFKDQIIDMGGALKGGGKIVSSENELDGPFMEAKEVVGGFMIIETETMEEAIQLVKESPGVMSPGASVEIREINKP